MVYKKFYMNDEELLNLNQKVEQTQFYRSSYLRIILEGYQAKEKWSPELTELYYQLHKLYEPLDRCRFMLSSRYKSASEKLEKAIKNLEILNFEIIETFGICEKAGEM